MQNSKSSFLKLFVVLLFGLVLAACGTSKKSGGYYQDDGPGKKRVDIDSVPNATPRNEPFNQATLKPYKVNGKRYVPLKSAEGFVQEGRASWYGKKYHGRKTSNGEVYDMYKMTAAHPTLPLPSYVRVTNVVNQRSVIVRVNDRGPFIGGRIIDLSYVAARKLGVVSSGTGNVIVESISSNYRSYTPNQQVANANSNVSNGNVSNSNVYNGTAVQSQGEIPAARTTNQAANQTYRYNLPASQAAANSAPSATTSQAVPQQAQGSQPQQPQAQQQYQQRPQLVPSYGASGQANQAYNNSNNKTAQQVPSQKYSSVPPRYSVEQWIQVGAFSQRGNAEKLISRLRGSGYQNVQIDQRNNLYKVLVGPINPRQVSTTQRSLRTNGYSAILAKP